MKDIVRLIKDYIKTFEKDYPKEILKFTYNEAYIEELLNSLSNLDSKTFVNLFLKPEEKLEISLAKTYILFAILYALTLGKLGQIFDNYYEKMINDEILLAEAFIQFELKEKLENLRQITFSQAMLLGIIVAYGANLKEWVENFKRICNEDLLKTIHRLSNILLNFLIKGEII